MNPQDEIPPGTPIKVWDAELMELARELAQDLQATRELYKIAQRV